MTLNLPFFRQLAKALAKQFGDNCEVVLHDLTSTDIEHDACGIGAVVNIKGIKTQRLLRMH